MLGEISHSYGALYPEDSRRRFGAHLVSDIGGGKSTLLGRGIAFLDFYRGVPTIVLDNGDAIDHFLHKFLKLPKNLREAWWSRIRYIDVSGHDGNIVSWPLYHKFANEDALTIAKRFVKTIIALDPALQNAAILGKGAIEKVAEPIGVALIERGWQISELPFLERKIPDSLAVRLIPFTYSKAMRAMYCADTRGLDWEEVIAKKQIVLLDYRHLEDPSFALSWILSDFLTFMQYRGANNAPVSLIIDELAALKQAQHIANTAFFEQWQAILKTTMRRFNLWLFLAHQYMGQFDKEMQDLLLSIKTQIVGTTTSMMTARTLSQQLARIDHDKVRRVRESVRPRLVSDGSGNLVNLGVREGIIGVNFYETHEEPVEYTAGQQYLDESYKFIDIAPLHFAVYHHSKFFAEHSLIGIEDDTDIEKHKETLSAIRKQLMARDGRKIDDVLTEIAARTAPSQSNQSAPSVFQNQPQPLAPSAPIQPPRPIRPITKKKPPR